MNHFYDGMSPSMKQLLETMCGGYFLSKNPDEAMDFLNYVAETSKGWDQNNLREVERMKPTANSRGGIYALTEDMELKAKMPTLNRRMEELEQRNHQEVRAVAEATMPSQPCFNCQSTGHQGEHCPISPSVRDLMVESASVVGQNRPPNDAQYGNTYNPNWKNHPNFAWKPKPPVYAPPRSTSAATVRIHFTAAAAINFITCGASYHEFKESGREFCGGAENYQCSDKPKNRKGGKLN